MRRLTAQVMIALETETDEPTAEIRRSLEHEIEMWVPRVHGADVTRVHVGSLTERDDAH